MVSVQRKSLADQAADLLLERIASGEWPVGGKLPGETTLAPQLGVGRSTVREAIRQLAGRGVLQTRQGAGVFVAAADASENWGLLLRRADIVAVIEGRIAIETEAAALAAERRTSSDIRAMHEALARRITPGQTTAQYVDADSVVHRAIVASAHNAVLLEFFDGFTPRMREAMIDMLDLPSNATTCDAGVPGEDHEVHEEIVRAIADADPARAAALTRAHLTALKAAQSSPPPTERQE
ncbi:FCD domain-containing protein [Agromyces sp. G08B096]|uniref:FCD domain-containing protein n=1 Tax=Agromyces sp. G08B096 TaxID=3156399 RepID=A0AAU7WC81_9MICO